MKLISKIILTLSIIFSAANFSATAQSTKDIHQKMHSHLLSDAKKSIDKSVLENYMSLDIESREQAALFDGLSSESIAMLSDLIDEAKTHIGKKYSYGSKGPKTFDCSGFTGYVYNQFGYNIGASSRGQYTLGESVSKQNLRVGDLVFFTSPRSGKNVGHVGIVVTADNEKGTFSFIHASIGQGIKISESTEAYYAKRYVGAKRIITE